MYLLAISCGKFNCALSLRDELKARISPSGSKRSAQCCNLQKPRDKLCKKIAVSVLAKNVLQGLVLSFTGRKLQVNLQIREVQIISYNLMSPVTVITKEIMLIKRTGTLVVYALPLFINHVFSPGNYLVCQFGPGNFTGLECIANLLDVINLSAAYYVHCPFLNMDSCCEYCVQ